MYTIDHIGIAVLDLDLSIKQYQSDFGFRLGVREKILSSKVEVAFMELPNSRIELIVPCDPTSSLQKFLNNHGPGLHHICYKVDDIIAELKRFADKNYTLIDKEPRPGAHNSLIAFLHPRDVGGVLTELCQHQK